MRWCEVSISARIWGGIALLMVLVTVAAPWLAPAIGDSAATTAFREHIAQVDTEAEDRAAARQLDEARAAQETLAQERERLQWQIGELEKLAPGEGEWAELNQRHERLAHAQALIDAAQTAREALQGDSDSGGSNALAALEQAQAALPAQSHIEHDFAPLAALLAAGGGQQPAPMSALVVEKHRLRGPDGRNATVSIARVPPESAALPND